MSKIKYEAHKPNNFTWGICRKIIICKCEYNCWNWDREYWREVVLELENEQENFKK